MLYAFGPVQEVWWKALGDVSMIAILLVAGAALAGMGNDDPVVTGLWTSADPVPAGSVVDVSCAAMDPDGLVRGMVISVSDGDLGGQDSVDTPLVPESSAGVVEVQWTAPGPGVATLSCYAYDNGGMFGGSSDSSVVELVVDVADASDPPELNALNARPETVFPNGQATITVDATNPTGGPLTYTWTTSAGTLSGMDDEDPGVVQLSAPATAGDVTVGVEVEANGVAVSEEVVVRVTGALGLPAMSGGPGAYPYRLGVGPAGHIYTTDPRRGTVLQLSPRGVVVRSIDVGGRPAGIALTDDEQMYVGDLLTGLVTRYNVAGQPTGTLASEAMKAPTDLAWDSAGLLLYVADSQTGHVFVFDADGVELPGFDVSAPRLSGIVVAFDGSVCVSDAENGLVHQYQTDGTRLQTFGDYGSDDGQLARIGGISLGTGLFVVDAYMARLSRFDEAGGHVENIGAPGSGPTALSMPIDVAIDPWGRLLVTSPGAGQVQLFALPNTTSVVCFADLDCDGITDGAELLAGLDPADPSDAFADPDRDGLITRDELGLGTDPFRADTDGDGVDDGLEVELGTDPLSDNTAPVAVAVLLPGDLVEPSLVTLDGRGSFDEDGDKLTYAWSVVSAPAEAVIDNAREAVAQLIPYAAGLYQVRLRVYDTDGWVGETETLLEVLQVPPTADAGADRGAEVGALVTLDGRYSSDANNDALLLTWEQVDGPAAVLDDQARRPSFIADQTGLLTFRLWASDGTSATSDLVQITVDAPDDHVPVAAATDEIAVGGAVVLDGRGSADSDLDSLGFQWTQIAGSPVTLVDPDSQSPSFTPLSPGSWLFSMFVDDGMHASAVAHSLVHTPDVVLLGPDRELSASTRKTVALICEPTEPCTWEQLGGVHVPLSAGTHDASFVPVEAGTYWFEVTRTDPLSADSATVWVVVDDPGGLQVPEAHATASEARKGALATLDARSSVDGNGGRLAYLWTQVAGPRVILDDPTAAVVIWQPELSGTYAWQLQVDNGITRSPPLRLEVEVPEDPDSGDLDTAGVP